MELGYTNNEPVNIALMSAIDSAVIHLIVKGIEEGLWRPENQNGKENPIFRKYSSETNQVL